MHYYEHMQLKTHPLVASNQYFIRHNSKLNTTAILTTASAQCAVLSSE